MKSYFLLFYGMFPVFYAVNIYILESMIHTDLWEYVTFVGKNLLNNKNCTKHVLFHFSFYFIQRRLEHVLL